MGALNFIIFLVSVFVNPTIRIVTKPTNLIIREQSSDGSAYDRIKSLLDTALMQHDTKTVASCYQQIGDIFFQQGVMPQALEYYYKANRQYSEVGNTTDLSANLNKIGKVYFKNLRDKEAMSVFRKALSLSGKANNHSGIAEANKYIAQIFERKGLADSAHNYLELALRSYRYLHNHEQVASTYAKIGSIYEDEGKFPLALKYFFKALELYQKDGGDGQAALLNNIGDTYRKTSDYPKALEYTRRAQDLALRLKDQQQVSSADRDLAKVFEKMGRFDSAYYYSEKARAAYAKSFNSESDKKLNLLQAVFEVQNKNAEIARLENDKHVNQIVIIAIAIVSLLLVFLSFSIISRQRLKSKDEKMLYEERTQTMTLELKNRELQEENLKNKFELQSKELSSHTLLIIQKNEFIEGLKKKVAHLIKDDRRDQRKELKQLIGLIDDNSEQDKNWEQFRIIYENIHKNFFDRLKERSDSLTQTDLRYLALTKMNLDPLDIATMLGISISSIRTTRYRVKKKLRLSDNETLSDFIQNL